MSSLSDFSRYQHVGWAKKLILATSLLVFVSFFGDSLIVFVGHCLHIFYEGLASIVEHWLQASLHLTERQSEIVYFYFSLCVGATLGWRLLLRIKCWLKQCYGDICFWCSNYNRAGWLYKSVIVGLAVLSSTWVFM